MQNSEQMKEIIFDLMNGILELEYYPVKESIYVRNEFTEESFYTKAYEEVFKANCRVCKRLGVQDNKDIELMINNLLDIGKNLSMKMFDYGVLLSSPSIK